MRPARSDQRAKRRKAGDRSINVLARALRDDPAPGVRVSAIEALGRVGRVWERRQLERAARDPRISPAAVRARAASTHARR